MPQPRPLELGGPATAAASSTGYLISMKVATKSGVVSLAGGSLGGLDYSCVAASREAQSTDEHGRSLDARGGAAALRGGLKD